MPARSTVSALALAVALPLLASVTPAWAGSWTPVEVRANPPSGPPVTPSAAAAQDCVWTRVRGWHHSGWLGAWHGCRPGPEWRYERRCWIGPGNIKHCRFYG